MIRKAMVTLAAILALVGGTRHEARADQASDTKQLVQERNDVKTSTTKKLVDLDKKMTDCEARAVDPKKATQADIDQLKRDAMSRKELIRADLARVENADKATIGEVKASLDKDVDAFKKILDEWHGKTLAKPHGTTAKKPAPKKPKK
jgi:hypothetical protein